MGVFAGVDVNAIVEVANGKGVRVGAAVSVTGKINSVGYAACISVTAGKGLGTLVAVFRNGIEIPFTGDNTLITSVGITSGLNRAAPTMPKAIRKRTIRMDENTRRPVRFLRFGLKTGASLAGLFLESDASMAGGCDSRSIGFCLI